MYLEKLGKRGEGHVYWEYREEGGGHVHREKIHQQQTADKNVGYVCVDKSDLLAQYDKINVNNILAKLK